MNAYTAFLIHPLTFLYMLIFFHILHIVSINTPYDTASASDWQSLVLALLLVASPCSSIGQETCYWKDRGLWLCERAQRTGMFATGQEWRFLLFCVQSAEEVWNANFMRTEAKKETEGKSSWGSVGGRET